MLNNHCHFRITGEANTISDFAQNLPEIIRRTKRPNVIFLADMFDVVAIDGNFAEIIKALDENNEIRGYALLHLEMRDSVLRQQHEKQKRIAEIQRAAATRHEVDE